MPANTPTIEELFKAGAHFGHSKTRSDARSHRFVYTYRNKISIINLEKTREMIEAALKYVEQKAKDGGVFLFVGTKLQAKEKVKETADKLSMPYIIERWPGGLLTNYEIISKTIRKMIKNETDLAESKLDYLKKKEKVKLDKDLKKMNMVFGGLKGLEKKPDVLIVVDAKEETNAIAEARKLNIKVIAIADTNANPKEIDFPIVANDDSKATITLILDLISETIKNNYKPKVVEVKTEPGDKKAPTSETVGAPTKSVGEAKPAAKKSESKTKKEKK